MRIKSINVQGYRSLYDVHFTPGDVTVLIGPNNSGKTNLMEALHFVSEVYEYDLETAINRKGGFENIAFRRIRRTKRPLRFRVVSEFSIEELRRFGRRRRPDSERSAERASRRIVVAHDFSFKAAGQAIESDFSVTHESLTITYRSRRSRIKLAQIERHGPELTDPTVQLASSEKHRSVLTRLRRELGVDPLDPFVDESYWAFVERNLSETDLLMSTAQFNTALAGFVREMAKAQLYQLSPLEVRRPGVPTPNADLSRHGSNLPALVAYMSRHDQLAWRQVLDGMQRIIPMLSDIRTDFTPDRRLTLQFVEEGVGRPWGVEEVSDGTMQSLALLAAIADYRTPVMLMEEPENSVHPWIIRAFVDACREATSKQIVISTHSPALVNYLTPSEVFVVWRTAQGRTQISRLVDLEEDAYSIWASGEVGTFDLIDSGLIREAVPGLSRPDRSRRE